MRVSQHAIKSRLLADEITCPATIVWCREMESGCALIGIGGSRLLAREWNLVAEWGGSLGRPDVKVSQWGWRRKFSEPSQR